jgi:hypothetical protein
VIRSPPQTVSFVEVGHAVDRLYAQHPDLRSFVVRDVQYTPRTRDKVLSVCHRGGPEQSRARRETIRIAGCAPLVFFFYSYGRRHGVPEAADVARKIYWYAVRAIRGPIDARATLTTLLRSWGVE